MWGNGSVHGGGEAAGRGGERCDKRRVNGKGR